MVGGTTWKKLQHGEWICTEQQQPRLEVLYEIAKILDVNPKDLLKEENLND